MVAFTIRPLPGSTSVSSVSAAPIPITIPPRSWLVAVFGLITRPTSNTATQRVTRTSPVSSSTATSQKWAPGAARTWRRWSSTTPARSRTLFAARPTALLAPTLERRAARPGEGLRVGLARAVRGEEPAVAGRQLVEPAPAQRRAGRALGQRERGPLQLFAGPQHARGDRGGLPGAAGHRPG